LKSDHSASFSRWSSWFHRQQSQRNACIVGEQPQQRAQLEYCYPNAYEKYHLQKLKARGGGFTFSTVDISPWSLSLATRIFYEAKKNRIKTEHTRIIEVTAL
jgi:hypothetical protein